jgi:hypothetical protein
VAGAVKPQALAGSCATWSYRSFRLLQVTATINVEYAILNS